MITRFRFCLALLLLPFATALPASEGMTVRPLLPAAPPPAAIRPAPPDTSYAHPQEGPVAECAGINRQFVLMNSRVVVGEPVLFRLALKSKSPEIPSEFFARLLWGTDVIAEVFPPQETGLRPYSYFGLEQGSVVPNSTVKFDTFTNFRYDFRMAVDKNTVSGAAFELPGEYRIRILLQCRVQGAATNMLDMGTFVLTVLPAEGDDERAFEILKADHRVFEYLHLRSPEYPNGRQPMTPRQVGLLEAVVAQCPNAALRPHAMILLAALKNRQEKRTEALGIYQQIQQEYAGTPLFDEARFNELRIYIIERDNRRSLELFNEVWADPYSTNAIYPGSPYWGTFVSPRMPKGSRTQWMLFNRPAEDPEMVRDVSAGPRIALDPEVRQQLGLPEEVTQEELNQRLTEVFGGGGGMNVTPFAPGSQ